MSVSRTSINLSGPTLRSLRDRRNIKLMDDRMYDVALRDIFENKN